MSSEDAKLIHLKKWDCKVLPNLLRLAMGTMRRGHPNTIEGDYKRVYQAQSILVAHMDGDGDRYRQWKDRHGDGSVLVVPGPEATLYLCPVCNYVI